MITLSRWPVRILAIGLGQALLVAASVAPQLSAHLQGDTYLAKVAPLDPVEPVRGVYLALSYPELGLDGSDPLSSDGRHGEPVYIPLTETGNTVTGGTPTRSRPEGLYLTCTDIYYQMSCGIESFFLTQEEANKLGGPLVNGQLVATIRIDNWGNATVIDLNIED
jgi:uncharacterized membrane-anchored protein